MRDHTPVLAPLFLLTALAGCSLDEQGYYTKFTEAECGLGLECFDADTLTFKGWTDAETCFDVLSPQVAAQGQGDCTYDPKAARECVKQLQDRTCPENDFDVDYPVICEAVFIDCAS